MRIGVLDLHLPLMAITAIAATYLNVADPIGAWHGKNLVSCSSNSIEVPSSTIAARCPQSQVILADQFRAAGIPDADIHFMPYEALPEIIDQVLDCSAGARRMRRRS